MIVKIASKNDFVKIGKILYKSCSCVQGYRALVGGSTFSVVYSKDPPEAGEKKFYQVVVRVSEDVRKVIKQNWIGRGTEWLSGAITAMALEQVWDSVGPAYTGININIDRSII